jgi:hypothetical protein
VHLLVLFTRNKFVTLLRDVGDDLPVDIEHNRRLESTTTQLRQSEISHYSYSMCHNKNSSFNIYGLMYYLSGVKPGDTVVPGSYGAPICNKMMYSLLLKRNQLSYTAWVDSLNNRDDGRGKTYRSHQKHESLTLHDLFFTGHDLLGVSFIICLNSNLRRALTSQNTT